jgi:tRNA nucleotidyltransferase (CCA-adding enzyme)
MDELKLDGDAVLERMRGLPGGPELLELAGGREDVELVGGAVRDLLLGRTPRELDVVVADDASSFARDLASSLGIASAEDPQGRFGIARHERFGTALVWWEGGRVDIACRRAESYAAPGALPDVRPGTIEQDLRRRDFTVNAIALSIGGPRTGELSTVPEAFEDLARSRLRVLHERSFLDDPTRLLRLSRYLARLEFEPEEHTAELAAQALSAGALSTVSGARVGAELRLLLDEPEPVAALGRLNALGVLSALHPQLRLQERVARSALGALPNDGRADLLLLASLFLPVTEDPGEDPERAMSGLLDDLEFSAGDRGRVIMTALMAPSLLGRLQAAQAPSELVEAAHAAPVEALALAGALAQQQGSSQAAAAARLWISELRHVRLQITGDDLLAAGIPAGPEIGRRLQLAMRRKLDGELPGDREAELAAAMEARPAPGRAAG